MNCAMHLPFTNHKEYVENDFVQHFWGRIPLSSGAALLSYSAESGMRELLHRIKYQNDQDLGEAMGKLMAIHYTNYFKGIDAIIPVPLHSDKQKLRGFNQCQSLAIGMSAVWGIPIWSDISLRTQSTETQTHKTRAERAAAMMSAFDFNHPEHYRNKHVLIIDDVMTTGATLEGCATALLKGAPVTISMMTLAMGQY